MVDPSQGEAGRPLLSSTDDASPPPSLRRPSRSGRASPTRLLRRLWKPLFILALPPLLLLVYSLVHPLVPALPPLPTVRIETGHGAASSSSSAEVDDDNTADGMIITSKSCVCGTTERGKQLCDTYHPQALASSRLVQGTGARIRRFLDKVQSGNDVKIGVLGGSVSACRFVHPSPEYPEGDPGGPACYTTLLTKWFKETFPSSSVELMNGAIGGMDSSYYAFCGTHHIAADVDLIVLEFDVNDQSEWIFQTFFDQLLRVLLEFKSQPAIVILGAWSPQVAQDQGYGDPQIVHLPIAHYYDIPYISLKRVIFNHYTRFPRSTTETFYLPDQLHPNARGHRLLADLLVGHLESELCLLQHHGLPVVPPVDQTIATTNPASSLVDVGFPLPVPAHGGEVEDWSQPPDGWEDTFDLSKIDAISGEKRHFALAQTPYNVPFVPIFTPLREVIDPALPDPDSPSHILTIAQPNLFCADANDRDHPMKPYYHDGWETYVWNGEKHYWVSSTVGARIRVDIKVNQGRVAIYYFRSQHYDLGDALCWVDDNEKGAVRLSGYWDKQYNMAVVSYIDQGVSPGDHYIVCEIANNATHPHNPDAHHFRIVAVMST